MRYVRWFLTIILCYGVYKETGICTGISMFLISLTFEILTVWVKETTELLGMMNPQAHEGA